jgi:3',5'-cyclic AMP phosphodiesterase CpdA
VIKNSETPVIDFRFAVISDPHVAIPQTIGTHSNRFHLVEVSLPALELVFNHLKQLDLDFLLLPGDLTQDGEPENHSWLGRQLSNLPFQAYVVPGNHDVPSLAATERAIAFNEFPYYYQQQGYRDPQQIYYTREILPGVQLIGLNSNQFNEEAKQIGRLDERQLLWLKNLLPQIQDKLVLVMIHHNVIEHLPGQADHELGRRYMLENAPSLLEILQQYGVKLIFTGHLHVQDITSRDGIYEITTGSLVSYPHPYRIIKFQQDNLGKQTLEIESHWIDQLPELHNLPEISRQWLGDRSYPFMMRLLTTSPLNLSVSEAELLAPKLRNFWADIAAGDHLFEFPDFPPVVQKYFKRFGAVNREGIPELIDNKAILII